jgi:hypothetical protein
MYDLAKPDVFIVNDVEGRRFDGGPFDWGWFRLSSRKPNILVVENDED